MAGEDNHIYGFNKPDSLELLQSIGTKTGLPSALGDALYAGYLVKTPVGGIGARSGSSVSFADCDVYYIDGTTITSSGIAVAVGNMSSYAIAGSTYGKALWSGGVLLFDHFDKGIINIRLSGNDLQYTFDGVTWTTWTTGTTCP